MRHSGFSLLEVIVAMAVLAIALTALLGSQNRSLTAVTEADFVARSAMLARTVMAQNLAAGIEPGEKSGDFRGQYPGYRWQIVVSVPDFSSIPVLDGVNGLLHRVTVIISAERQQRKFTLNRIVLRRNQP